MVVKVYISGISGNKEVKKRQQRVSMILDSKNITYEVIDITEPGREADKDFMQNNAKSNGGTVSDPNPRSPLPPQVFNDEEYCGDYDQFDLANEVDTLEQFLKLEIPPEAPPQTDDHKETSMNGHIKEQTEASKENSQERESADKTDVPKSTDTPKEGTPVKEGTPGKESTPNKESSPGKEKSPVKEGSVMKDDPKDVTEDAVKEGSPENEKSQERQVVDIDDTTEKAKSPEKDIVSEHSSKETTPGVSESVNENGTVSSRDHSEEKATGDEQIEIKDKKVDNPSEALIQSEQQAAAE